MPPGLPDAPELRVLRLWRGLEGGVMNVKKGFKGG
jgi:hypothetical protein